MSTESIPRPGTAPRAGTPAAERHRPPRIVIVADDLVWATRLEGLVRGAGARPTMSRDMSGLQRLLDDPDRAVGVVVDLTARAYDGVQAVALAARAGRSVLAAGQHDDLELRRRALAAGATRVLPYARLHAAGPALLRAWVASLNAGGAGT